MNYEVAVIGAGIVGLATAYHVMRTPGGSRVAVVDALGGPGMGDTSRSVGGFRTAFTSSVNRVLARSSVEFYEEVQRAGYDLGMRRTGYMFLATASNVDALGKLLGDGADFVDEGELEEMGIRTHVSNLDDAAVLGLEDLVGGFLYRDAGIFDPHLIVEYYVEKLEEMGCDFKYGAEARMVMEPVRPLGMPGEPFPWQEVRVRGFSIGNAEVNADAVVLATGAWTGGILDDIGFPLPLRPLRRMAYSVRAMSGALGELLSRDIPALVIPGGVFLRPDPGGAFHVEFGLRRPYGPEEPEPEAWELGALPILSSYLPAFEGVAPSDSWVGRYDMNIVTGTPIVERLVDGLLAAAGTSGSGVMKADAIGRVAAALALGKERVELHGGISMDPMALSAPSGEERLVI
ncbi:MAG: NAD(P)/FAD-dependent oxidoreductase [Conexivisphaera sp.]|jgi:glycine/D-amino acid oxidase-like deaminating enzyme